MPLENVKNSIDFLVGASEKSDDEDKSDCSNEEYESEVEEQGKRKLDETFVLQFF